MVQWIGLGAFIAVVWVQSLVRVLRSNKLCSTARKQKQTHKNPPNLYWTEPQQLRGCLLQQISDAAMLTNKHSMVRALFLLFVWLADFCSRRHCLLGRLYLPIKQEGIKDNKMLRVNNFQVDLISLKNAIR